MKNILLLFIFICVSQISFSQSNQWIWERRSVSNHREAGTAVATDATGNIYMAGYFEGDTIRFDTITLVRNGIVSTTSFLVKYDPSGSVLWGKTIDNNSIISAIAISSSGNIYVAGNFETDTFTLGTIVLPSTQTWFHDVFIAAFNSSGNVQWADRFGGTGDDYCTGLSCDLNGNVSIIGQFSSSQIIIGNHPLSNPGSYNIFLAKYNSSSNVLWAIAAGGTGNNKFFSINTDANGNLYASGSFSGQIDFGTDTLFGNEFIFIAKFDLAGNALWIKSFAGQFWNGNMTLYRDKLYLSGSFFDEDVLLDSISVPNIHFNNNTNSTDAFIAKLDTSAHVIWAKSFGSNAQDNVFDMVIDQNENIYFSGNVDDTMYSIDNIPLTLPPTSFSSIFIAAFDPSGTPILTQLLESRLQIRADALAADASGNIFLTCGYGLGIILGNDTLLTNSTGEALLAKLSGTTVNVNQLPVKKHFVYPNPANASINFNVANNIISMNVYDSTGKCFYSGLISFFSTDLLKTGIYLFQFYNKSEMYSEKIIIQK